MVLLHENNFFNRFSNQFLNTYSKDTPINHLWSEFKNACLNCLNNLIPSKISSAKFHQPWITNAIKCLSRCKKRAFIQFRQTRSPATWEYYKNLKKLTQQECRRAYNSYILRIINPNSKIDYKKLWSYIKSKRIDHVSIPAPILHDGTTVTNTICKANILNNHFSSVFTIENDQFAPVLDNSPYPDIQPLKFQVNDVAEILSTLEIQKSPGPDNLPPRLLKSAVHEIAPILTLIFNASFQQGELPFEWK